MGYRTAQEGLRPRDYARQTEAGRTFKFGTGTEKYTAWRGTAGQPCVSIAAGFPFTGPDDMPDTWEGKLTAVRAWISSDANAYILTARQVGGIWTVRDIHDVTGQVAGWVNFDLTGHAGGGLKIRIGDSVGFFMTAGTVSNAVAAAAVANLNGVSAAQHVNYTGGVPGAGDALAGLAGDSITPVFEATIESVPGFLWTNDNAAIGTKVALPQFPDDRESFYVAVRRAMIAGGEKLTVALQKQNASTGAWENSNAVDFDMAYTSNDADVVTFDGTDVALGTAHGGTCTGGVFGATVAGQTEITLDTGTAYNWFDDGARLLQIDGVGTFPIATYTDADTVFVTGDASAASGSTWRLSEGGDTFDILLKINQAESTFEIMWMNLRTGQSGYAGHGGITMRHWSDTVQASYGNSETLADAGKHYGIKVTSTGGSSTIDAIEWGRQPVVAGVSSWGVQKGGATDDLASETVAAVSHVIWKLEPLLAPRRMLLLGGIYGGRFYSTTANFGLRQRFGAADAAGNSLDPVPGIHNLRSITGGFLVMEGVPNDLTSITANGGRAYLRKILLDMESLLDLCNQQDITAVLASTLPRGENDTTDNLIGTNAAARRRFNATARARCEWYGASFIDVARVLTVGETWNTPYEVVRNEWVGNEGHLTYEGDEILAAMIAPALNCSPYTQTPYEVG